MTNHTATDKPLLDVVCDRFAADQARRDRGEVVRQDTDDMQLALFDFNDAGDAVAWNGASL